MGFCKDIHALRQVLTKGEWGGGRQLTKQFKEKCEEGEDPEKDNVVTKGKHVYPGGSRKDNWEGRGCSLNRDRQGVLGGRSVGRT